MAPISVQDHASLGLLRYFEATQDLLVLQGPNEELIVDSTRGQKLIIGVEGETEDGGPIFKINN